MKKSQILLLTSFAAALVPFLPFTEFQEIRVIANEVVHRKSFNGDLIAQKPSQFRQVWAVAYSSDGKLIASTNDDTTVKIWKIGEAEPIQTLLGHSEQVLGVAFSPDNKGNCQD